MAINEGAWKVGFRWTKGDASNPTGALAVDTTSKAMHFCDIADANTDWNVSADTNPAFYLHSATVADYIKMYHDATDAYLDIVGGNLKLAIDGAAEIVLTTAAFSPATSDGNALGTSSLMWADLFLASGGVINFNNGDITVTHSANALAFSGATAAGINGYSFDIAAGTIASEAHGVDVTATGTLASGKGLVGLNIATTTAGTAGAWASGIYAKVVQGATKNVNGYLSAAEFELVNSADNVSDEFVLVLNSQNNGANRGSHESYIALRDYGSLAANSLLWLGDATIGTNDATVLISSTAAKTHSHSMRILAGSTAYWVMLTSTPPAA